MTARTFSEQMKNVERAAEDGHLPADPASNVRAAEAAHQARAKEEVDTRRRPASDAAHDASQADEG